MSYNAVAEKYAKALFEAVEDKKTALAIEKELLEVATVFTSDIIAFFDNPFNAQADKLVTISQAFEGKVSAETLNYLKVLTEKNRIPAIKEIAITFSNLVKAGEGTVKGRLFSPSEPAAEFIKNVEDALSKTIGQKVELEFHKDAALIAGFKVEVGGWTIDDSASAHLNKIKDDLMKRGL